MILRLSKLYLSNEYKDNGCPEGNWICKKLAESELYQDQNSKLWMKKGYCVPKTCKIHRDCMIGDYCNGGRIAKGVRCYKDDKKRYLIAKCVKLIDSVEDILFLFF